MSRRLVVESVGFSGRLPISLASLRSRSYGPVREGPVGMRSATLRRLVGLWPGAVALLLATGLSAPSTARAACSSHVAARANPIDAAHRLELLALLGRSPADAPEGPTEAPSPCPGGMCSRGLPMPL